MKKHILMLALGTVVAAGLFLASPSKAYAADCFNNASAMPIYVDESVVPPVEYVQHDSESFASVKSMAVVMGADSVKCDQGTVTVSYQGRSIVFTDNSRLAVVDEYYYIIGTSHCRMENNTLMAPTKLLYRVFGSEAVWQDNSVYITTGAGFSEDLSGYEIELLANLVQAEAGNQSLEGKIGVVNVVLNRINSSHFPDNITDIIFDTNNGVQFTTAYNGAIYNTPTQECYDAIDRALEGENVIGDCLFFASTTDCWAARNRTFVMMVGDHYFFA